MLSINDLHATINGKEILKGLTLDVKPGEVHAIMGPNGAGKSTLGHVLAGREGYEVTSGTVEMLGKNLLELETEERAHLGLFLSFQYPIEIPGVSNMEFLKASVDS
ncbi:MAG: ATP-binding cassette domain-containing protein, partial [Pseudomonadales bacterium]